MPTLSAAAQKRADDLAKRREIDDAITDALKRAAHNHFEKPADVALFIRGGLKRAGFTIIRSA